MKYTLDEQTRIANQAGSPKDVAKANGVSTSAVHNWRYKISPNPKAKLRYKRFSAKAIQSIIRESGTLAAIGKRYSVTGACIHVWRHQAGLTHINLDDATRLKAAMTPGSPGTVCKLYNVSGFSIRKWRTKFGLTEKRTWEKKQS